jgi:hypothetical protein
MGAAPRLHRRCCSPAQRQHGLPRILHGTGGLLAACGGLLGAGQTAGASHGSAGWQPTNQLCSAAAQCNPVRACMGRLQSLREPAALCGGGRSAELSIVVLAATPAGSAQLHPRTTSPHPGPGVQVTGCCSTSIGLCTNVLPHAPDSRVARGRRPLSDQSLVLKPTDKLGSMSAPRAQLPPFPTTPTHSGAVGPNQPRLASHVWYKSVDPCKWFVLLAPGSSLAQTHRRQLTQHAFRAVADATRQNTLYHTGPMQQKAAAAARQAYEQVQTAAACDALRAADASFQAAHTAAEACREAMQLAGGSCQPYAEWAEAEQQREQSRLIKLRCAKRQWCLAHRNHSVTISPSL